MFLSSDPRLQKCHHCCKVPLSCQEVTAKPFFFFCAYIFASSDALTLMCLCVICLRAQSYSERLRLGLAVMHGEAHQADMLDGLYSPPVSRTTVGHTGLELPCKTKHCLHVCLQVSTLCFLFFCNLCQPCTDGMATLIINQFSTDSVFCYWLLQKNPFPV